MILTQKEEQLDLTLSEICFDEYDPGEYEMPPDDLVNSWGSDGEQSAIIYMIDRALKSRRISRITLAEEAEMSISQLTNLYHGFRGVPVKRFSEFTKATRSFALLKFYAKKFHLVLITQREWGKLTREKEETQSKLEAIEAENAELKARLARYGEDLGQ